jgi:hypothetical protein
MVSLIKSTMRGGLGLLAVAASAWLGAGCTTESTVQGPPAEETEAEFCAELAKAECSASLVTSCYNLETGPNASQTRLTKDTDTCVSAASRTAVCNPSGLPFHAEAADAAIMTITGIFSDGELTHQELPTLNAALATVFNRGLASGSKCTLDTDCDAAGGLTCINHAGQGICGKARVVGPGQSCSLAAEACDTDNFCDKGTGGLFCRERLAAGTKGCVGDYECAEGTHCGGDGTCHKLAGDGASCSITSDCDEGLCLKQQSDDKTGQCAAVDKFDHFSASCDAYLPQ